MTPEEATEMRERSGHVSDQRRVVSFLYLLLRDHLPAERIETALHLADTVSNVDALSQETRDRACWICNFPKSRVVAFVSLLEPAMQGRWHEVQGRLPLRDDIETIFTNGWLALYAKDLAERLLK